MKFHNFGLISSTLDKAQELAKSGRLNEWDCVLANRQSAGRGQLRSSWLSLEGNLFLTIRLPCEPPFTNSAGAVATGSLCADALSRLANCAIFLKWPNDLLISQKGQWLKAGGILLEERYGFLYAGIGINLTSAPEKKDLDENEALKPGCLETCCGMEKGHPFHFGRRLAILMREIWKSCDFNSAWLPLANDFLAWRGDKVCILENHNENCGLLEAIEENGGCLIRIDGSTVEFTHGTMRKCDSF